MKYQELILNAKDSVLQNFPEIIRGIDSLDIMEEDLIHIVKDNEDNKLVYWSMISSIEKINIKLTFNAIYDRIKIKSEDNISILTSFYQRVRPEEIVEVINNPFREQDAYLDELLKESNGYLIYRHQFEKILTDKLSFSDQDAVALRKAWNIKRHSKIEKLKKDPYFLHVSKRMCFYFVISKSES